jgi:choline dehydrogenase-like flavoprotein
VTLTPTQRATLDALCRRMVPVAYVATAPATDLATLVWARLEDGDPVLRDQVATLLSLFGHAFSTFVTAGRVRRFAELDPATQDRVLHAWGGSRVALRRTIYQALRRLILSTYYAMPFAHGAIGFRGPLHRRETAVPWEGALIGVPTDGEPVLRVSDAARARDAHRSLVGASVARGVTEGTDVTADVSLTADVCVVGTGAGGAVVAARLAEAGYDVVLLEEGGYWQASDFSEEEAEMVPRLYADRGTRATDDLSIALLQGRCVGGGTTVNWMIMLRTRDWVLDEWAAEHGTEGMRPTDLAPVFDLIEGEVHARLVPPDAHAPGNRIILNGAATLGWSAAPAKINARDCVRAGFCGIGCRYGAKQSTLNTFVPRALAAGARLFADVRVDTVERIERQGIAPMKRVRGTVIDRATHRGRHAITVDAPVVVLAAGAVGTPAILQRSGLGGGGVGRYLRLHPTSAVIGLYDREIYGTAGIPQSALADEFLRGSDGYGFWIECPSLLPGLASVAVPGFGDEHRRVMEQFPRLGSLIVLTRDGADRTRSDGEVSLDRRGRTHIRYRISPRNAATLHAGLAAVARLHLAAGAREILTLHEPAVMIRNEGDVAGIARAPRGTNRLSMFSAHVNGTCRIGTDPRTSGTDPSGQRHGVPGLYVADGSILPTAPGVNPQETIMALATVIARRIIDRHSMRTRAPARAPTSSATHRES